MPPSTDRLHDVSPHERALLVTVALGRQRTRACWRVEDEADELRELTLSCGLDIVEQLQCNRQEPTPTYVIGRGKVEEIAELARTVNADCVIFNIELSATQQRNIEEIVEMKTIDRTQLILDIFAQRAISQEGKVQVELAQLVYLLPRLMGKGVLLSRLGGGIGTRGPGEQKLEVDRRRIRMRITRLKEALIQLSRRRGTARRTRKEHDVPTAALIGYTNAGKTTLLNRLTGASSTVENRMFTTLDPLARRVTLPNHQTIVLLDTVGFLHRLPHHVIEAFKATLEEAAAADLLLCVMDASHPMAVERGEAVLEVLGELDAVQRPRLYVFNKIDQLNDHGTVHRLEGVFGPGVAVSATTGQGLDRLQEQIMQALGQTHMTARLAIPPEHYALLERLYKEGEVISKAYEEGVYIVEARIPLKIKWLFEPYIRP